MTSLSWGYDQFMVSKMILLDNKSFCLKLWIAFPSVILAFINCIKDALLDFGNQETSQWPGYKLCPSRKVLAFCWANQWQSSSEASSSTLPNWGCTSSLNDWRRLSDHDSVTTLPLGREYLAIIHLRAPLNGLANLELWIWQTPVFFH